jgi:hypothetical protein
MANIRHFHCFLSFLFSCIRCFGQFENNFENTRFISKQSLSRIEKHMNSMNGDIEKKTIQLLSTLERQENKLRGKVALKDSLAAKTLFVTNDTYRLLVGKIKNGVLSKGDGDYIPDLDSLKTGLMFLEQAKMLQRNLPEEWQSTATSVTKSIDGVRSKLGQTDAIKSYISDRKMLLKEQFEKYGMAKELKKLENSFHYYQQQIVEYRNMLKDPKKVETRILAELRKLPAFTEFMKKNSQMAQLFHLPGNAGTFQNAAGLQTRASVQSGISEKFGSVGNSGNQYIQQQISQAQSELNAVKDKINKAGGGQGNLEMPAFTADNQRTKKFLERIEYGANFQSQKTNSFLPVTTDLALTAGYKLNDKSIVGIAVSYKLGWGDGWQHIKITNEGIGLRSFLDLKLKGSVWISGGYEQNYQMAFKKIELLKDLNAWQTSGLIGVTKKYTIGKKTNRFQLLWDFLSYYQLPKRQPLLFRIGFGF